MILTAFMLPMILPCKKELSLPRLSNARSAMSFVENTATNLKYEQRNIRKHEIEWHKKFTLAAACLIFLFVGAPLGAIIRKGGMGMPTVISTVLFILYYVISLIGEKVVRESIVSSYSGNVAVLFHPGRGWRIPNLQGYQRFLHAEC